MTQSLFKKLTMLSAAALMLAACGQPADNHAHDGEGHGHEEAAHDEVAKGPNGGRLLEDGAFAIEVTIFEQGTPPQFRLFAYENGRTIAPSAVDASITLSRLDGEENYFPFETEGGYLSGDGVVTEPHSFDVAVKATYKGKTHTWSYDSYEGRTTISAAMANQMGIEVEAVGPQIIESTLDLLGRVEFAPDAQSTLRARFPGKILEVRKTEGQTVKEGQVLARIESNESLRPYDITAPMDGVIVSRTAQKGDVVSDSPLFVIGDLTRLRVDFHVYPGDTDIVRPGQMVAVSSVDGRHTAKAELEFYLPTAESATQTLIMHAPLANPTKEWIPGMTVKGKAIVAKREVPLAVRPEALQRFRDFTVVFAQVGETYEVRMLELGERTPEWVEVLGGIKPGQPYVTSNSFIIKADIEKDGASHDH
ncbi:efflux RND transporter periplasmic adaptor subunit [Kordiimonas sp.]|uniref:efflux RND transporter periplasmic adaptor subunit n=1 Tax=Kordiimonas sp. TaxID=1970157 RepID=UPI003A8E57A2